MHRVTEIEKRIGSSETPGKFLARQPQALHLPELMRVIPADLVKQAVGIAKSMGMQPPLENANTPGIFARIGGRRQNLHPDGLEAEAPQPQHPLERHGKIAAAFGIFCRKPAAQENRHSQRIACIALCSTARRRSFDGPSIIR